MSLVVNTAIFSLIVQVIAGVFLVLGFFYKLNKEEKVLKTIITLELIVQIIELIFYVFIIRLFASGDIDTSFRYRDWFFSTPVMLISTMLFLVYLQQRKENDEIRKVNPEAVKSVDVKAVFSDNKLLVIGIILFNALMLITGYLGEKGRMPIIPAFIFGTIFLTASFGCLYKFAHPTMFGRIFIGIMFFIWALYGFAFLMPLKAKNISYNILDIFSKNFYGVFLYIIIATHYGRII